ncbi:hypothetical protein F750_5598 [Streptomyces sp. PAMC 26508]|nr:hypothetical protein F750_5598 [Streptomyces sp. PAMC 26508]
MERLWAREVARRAFPRISSTAPGNPAICTTQAQLTAVAGPFA